MFPHLLLVRPAEADRPNDDVADGEGEAETLPVDPAKGAEADFAIVAAIVHEDRCGKKVEPGCVRQRHAMLGDIRGVLRSIELKFHVGLGRCTNLSRQEVFASTRVLPLSPKLVVPR